MPRPMRIYLVESIVMMLVFVPAMLGMQYPMWLSYQGHKALHLLGVVLFVGNIVITALWATMAMRTRDPKLTRFATRAVVWMDTYTTGPGFILALYNGLVMAPVHGGLFGTSWMIGSLVLFALMGVLSPWLLWVQWRMWTLALPAPGGTEDDPLPDEYYRLVRQWSWAGLALTVVPVGMFVFMVLKPTLW